MKPKQRTIQHPRHGALIVRPEPIPKPPNAWRRFLRALGFSVLVLASIQARANQTTTSGGPSKEVTIVGASSGGGAVSFSSGSAEYPFYTYVLGGVTIYSTAPLSIELTSGTMRTKPLWVVWDSSGAVHVYDSTVSVNGIELLATKALQTSGNSSLTTLAAKDFALESGGNLASIKAKTDNIPALGQQLAANSAPVVLTALQLAALTPPAAITNYATESGGNLATLAAKDYATSAKQDLQATAASQYTGNAALSSIDYKLSKSSNTAGQAVLPTQDLDLNGVLQQMLVQLRNLNNRMFFIHAALSPSTLTPLE